MTDTAPMPDAMTAPIAEIMSARATGVIDGMAWSRTYADAVQNRLRVDSGLPAESPEATPQLKDFPTAHSQPLETATTEAYAPAASADEYAFSTSRYPTEEEVQSIVQIREAMFEAKLPSVTGNAVIAAMDETGRSMRGASETELQGFAHREASGLRKLWGEHFDAKVAAVDSYLEQSAQNNTLVNFLLTDPNMRYVLADRRVVLALSQMLEARKSR